MNDPIDKQEWTRLYEAVRATCRAHGKEDSVGGADFWVVDDCWGGVSQKLIVSNPSFLTRQLVRELSDCINKLELLGAEIVIVLEAAKIGATESNSGLVVHSAGFEEYWDIDKLRAEFGESFFQ